MTRPAAPTTRRAVLAGGAALPLLIGLNRSALAVPVPLRSYADMHVHLFNAHDLPVGMFMVEVLFRKQRLPRALKFVIDFLVRRAQDLAISAAAERRRLAPGSAALPGRREYTPEAFGADLAAWGQAKALEGPASAKLFADEDLREGYDELVAAVLADTRGTTIDAIKRRFGPRFAAPSQASGAQKAFTELARRAESTRGPQPGDKILDGAAAPFAAASVPAISCQEECPEHVYDMSFAAILRYLGWGYLMLKSREFHLTKYLRLARRQGEWPASIVNHLVDYDDWLGVDRLNGSSHADQVEVAQVLAAKYRTPRGRTPGVAISTFAGFCPLKHALETRDLGSAPSLDSLLTLAEDGKVAGFKLYPPMGFQASGNTALTNKEFDPRSSFRSEHFAKWSGKFGGGPDGHEIGTALDTSLDAFYKICARKRIPLMAHAGPGNEAGPEFGQRANPKHWIAVAQKYKLRISLGHLVNSAEDFVCAVSAGTAPRCVWALHAAKRLLDLRETFEATVYGDLAFMPELIGRPALAIEFFKAIGTVFGPGDPKLTRIVYGSDYIMLGSMKDYDEHLLVMRRAMDFAGFDAEMIENILVHNARRFLQVW